MRIHLAFILLCLSVLTASGQQKSYRLNSVDLKPRVIWGAECRQPPGHGLAFGGQDQDSDDGRPHTRILIDGKWKAIHADLRNANPLQTLQQQIWSHRQTAKNTLARARFFYFQDTEEDTLLQTDVRSPTVKLVEDLQALETTLASTVTGDADRQTQSEFARQHIGKARKLIPSFEDGIHPDALRSLHQAQIQLEIASEALDAEPPPRTMNCGTARRSQDESRPASDTLVYDSSTGLYVLFGGDHLDYLTNDTWVFDPKTLRWYQRHPQGAPPPRANHRLTASGDGKIRMTGGYTYSSNTDYLGGQYVDHNDGDWTYDLETNAWTGSKLVSPETRIYRTGPFHPEFYFDGPKPDAEQFQAWLKTIPVNEWTTTDPPRLPRLNRDWGTARIDPDRDLILRWSGGHSAHGGTDVLHFHFATNRWELPFPVEFPLGQLYSNTSYPNGFNFNMRPWMTGHTYQNYHYDLPSRKLIKAGRPRHFYVYDPDLGDWTGRGVKPEAMQYNSCFYTLALTATPRGIVCWDKHGRVHRYDHQLEKWIELELSGDPLPGAYVDNSTIAYDSKRDRVLMINTLGYGKPFDGEVWSLDLKTRNVKALAPRGREHAHLFSNVDKCCYDAENDLLLLGAYLKDAGDHTPTPAYDCRRNRWITLNIKYATGTRGERTTRAFPHQRSDGLMFDPLRKLVWGTDTNSQVYVLRLNMETVDVNILN